MGEIPTPEPGEGEVLIRPLRIGLRLSAGTGGLEAHGIAGEVVRVGPKVDEIFPGDRCAVRSVVGCGECEFCYGAQENLCTRAYHTHGFGEAGAFAEFFVIPPAAIQAGCLIQLPEGIDPDTGVFVEPLAYCWNGLSHIPIERSTRLVVIGAGLPGILCGIIGRYRNAKTVMICDPDVQRIEILRGLDIPFDSILAGGDEAVARILAENPGGVEAVACTLPDPASIRRALALGALGAHISLQSPLPAASGATVDAAVLSRRELHLHGSAGSSRSDHIDARHLIAEGLVPAAQLITRRFPVQDLKAALDHLADPASRPLAVSLEFPAQEPLVPERPAREEATPAEAPGGEAAPAEAEAAIREPEAAPESPEWSAGLTEEEISEMARRVREPVFDYGPGSNLNPSGEIAPWPDLSPEYWQEKERFRKQRAERRKRREAEARPPARPRAQQPRPKPERAPPEKAEEGRKRHRRKGRKKALPHEAPAPQEGFERLEEFERIQDFERVEEPEEVEGFMPLDELKPLEEIRSLEDVKRLEDIPPLEPEIPLEWPRQEPPEEAAAPEEKWGLPADSDLEPESRESRMRFEDLFRNATESAPLEPERLEEIPEAAASEPAPPDGGPSEPIEAAAAAAGIPEEPPPPPPPAAPEARQLEIDLGMGPGILGGPQGPPRPQGPPPGPRRRPQRSAPRPGRPRGGPRAAPGGSAKGPRRPGIPKRPPQAAAPRDQKAARQGKSPPDRGERAARKPQRPPRPFRQASQPAEKPSGLPGGPAEKPPPKEKDPLSTWPDFWGEDEKKPRD